MTKIIYCRDVGFDCEGVIRAATEEEALRMVIEHAKTVHGLDQISPEVVNKVKSVMVEDSTGLD